MCVNVFLLCVISLACIVLVLLLVVVWTAVSALPGCPAILLSVTIMPVHVNMAKYNTHIIVDQSKRELEHQVAEINASRPQCPVGLNTLVLPSKNTISDSDKAPYVYLNCGHVHGQHSWGKGTGDANNCTCPMCLKVLSCCIIKFSYISLQLGNANILRSHPPRTEQP